MILSLLPIFLQNLLEEKGLTKLNALSFDDNRFIVECKASTFGCGTNFCATYCDKNVFFQLLDLG